MLVLMISLGVQRIYLSLHVVQISCCSAIRVYFLLLMPLLKFQHIIICMCHLFPSFLLPSPQMTLKKKGNKYKQERNVWRVEVVKGESN